MNTPYLNSWVEIKKIYKEIKFYCGKNHWNLISWYFSNNGYVVIFSENGNQHTIFITEPKDLRKIKKENNYVSNTHTNNK